MSKREKILAGAVGLLVVVGLLFFGARSMFSGSGETKDEVTLLIEGNQKLRLENRQTALEAERLVAFKQRALPYDREEARRVYQKWLFDLANKEVALQQVDIKPPAESANRDVWRQFSFTVNGVGTLEQITQFLFRFHKSNLLHRIGSLRITPIKDSKNLKITMRADALALPGAPSGQPLADQPGSDLRYETLADYNEIILERNLFGPENNPPSFRSPGTQRGYRGKSVSISLSASDKDPLDKISWKLVNAPEGARLRDSGDKATVSWSPTENGDYTFVVSASDDGVPSRTTTAEFSVSITDPPPPREVVKTTPPPKPKFDVSKYTVLSSVLKGKDGREVAWLYERPTDRLVKRSVGEPFEIGAVSGVITSIEGNRVIFQADEKLYVLSLGEILSDAQPHAPSGA